MQQYQRSAPTSLFPVLREVVENMQRVSGADIVSLYPYDAESRTYYAPCAIGIPEEGLLGSLPDMQDQLHRYLADAAEGKAPDDLTPQQYGPNVWLTITRRTLWARDAQQEISSSFIRRLRIQTMVGLPLIAGDTLVGLLYLNFSLPEQAAPESGPAGRRRAARAPERPLLDDKRIAELEREAARAAMAIERARDGEERAALSAIDELAALLAAPPAETAGGVEHFQTQRSHALVRLLEVTGFDGAAVYRQTSPTARLELVAERGLPGAPPAIVGWHEALDGVSLDPTADAGLRRALETAGLHAVATLPLRTGGQSRGALIVLSRDRLAYIRKAPGTRAVLKSVTDLVAGGLEAQQLIASLEESNRTLSALSRLTSTILQPGATRLQVLEAVIRHLTDPKIPEFEFEYASVFLLAEGESGTLTVPVGIRIEAPTERGPTRPTVQPERTLSPTDVLVYCSQHRRVVVMGAADGEDDEVVVGYANDQLDLRQIPAVRSDGGVSARVRAALVREPGAGWAADAADATPFTLDGDMFEADRHRDLVRVFVPFGLDAGGQATGVLEAGHHLARKRRLERTQVDALRACAAQIAIAVETARLYEESRRHAEHLVIITDISRAIASSIDLDQTLRLVARNLTRTVDASLGMIALYDDDGSAWYGAAASDMEEIWRRQRVERPDPSALFEVLDRRAPLTIEDVSTSDLVSPYHARLFGIRSLMALPLIADDEAIGAIVLAQRDGRRRFTPEEVQRTEGLAAQAAVAIKNARVHALQEEAQHIQKDVVLLGFGQWGQRGYGHLVNLKQFFNFKTHVVVPDDPARRDELAAIEERLRANGDALYLDSPESPAREQLHRELESSCYVVTYIATPAATHLPLLADYHELSNVVLIEKPLGAPLEAYREFLASAPEGVEIVAADHYYFKLEVRLLQLLLTEERTLRAFLDTVEEIEVELLEEQPFTAASAEIGIIADMIPHAFAIISLLTPIDRINFSPDAVTGAPLLQVGRYEPLQGQKATYTRLTTTFPLNGRTVRLIIDSGKGVTNSKWIKLSGERRPGSRRSFYKFDFNKGEAIDGTQTNLRAAVRPIRQPGVPDNAHLTMLRHTIERKHPAVGILAIREAMRSNQHIQELDALAAELIARGEWTSYRQGLRPDFAAARVLATQPNGRAALGAPVASD